MSGISVEFLDDFIQFLETEISSEVSSEDRFFSNIRARPFGDSMVQIHDISYLTRDDDEELIRVNSTLSSSSVVFEFQCESDVGGWATWNEFLVSYVARLNVGLVPPYTVKWERDSNGGRIKSDERLDVTSDYLAEDIPAKPSVEIAVETLLHDYLIRDQEMFDCRSVKPEKIRSLFNKKPGSMAKL